MFAKILVANRGEIAVRIIAAAQTMGIGTVAVFSEADVGALHVRLADESRCIGPAPARQSYLDIDAIVQAAHESGAEAVHPGYGFLSESPQFAAAVTAAGLTFIGPAPETIALMADKVAARAAAVAAGIPVLPGSGQAVESLEEARTLAERIGFPIAVKANFGGGGRGLRIAANEAGLEAAMDSARREAAAAFGRGEIFLEKYLAKPRHVEVQILGDTHGNIIHLGDRDCTVQRRHQKMLEEAPAPDLAPDLRAALHQAALSLARSVNYASAGTVEFLVDAEAQGFSFLEMNTRLQVEHGVTELVTGIDIVEAQIAIAAGRPLALSQNEVAMSGHAIQARIAAEDPWEDFRPAPGLVGALALPLRPWLRLDFGVEQGDSVQPHYDSLIGKLLAWGSDRDAAIRRLRHALRALRVGGLPTTAPYLADILARPDFIAVRHHTGSVEADWLPDPAHRPPAAAPAESRDPVTRNITERQVTLPGSPPRQIAIFGAAGGSAIAPGSGRRARQGAGEGPGREAAVGAKVVASPMDGMLVQLRVEAGQQVAEGQPLAILEAMKMEVVLPAPCSGTVKHVAATAGTPVNKGQLLIELE